MSERAPTAPLKHFLVINPASANGSTGRQFAQIRDAVRAAVGDFEHAFTTGPGDGTRLAAQALSAGFDCVVAVGGDGTASEVANGFFRDGAPVRPGASLGLIPCGTGCDFRRVFGWSRDVREAAARLSGARTVPLDVGRVEFTGHDGAKLTRYFVNETSAGVSACVTLEVNRASKALGGRLSFALGTVRAMLKYSDRRVRMQLDDGPKTEVDATVLAVANGQYFGGGMMVAPDARPDDGIFDLTLWSGYGVFDFATKSPTLYNGRHVDLSKTSRYRARRVRLEADEPTMIEVDGEPVGRLPATIEILPAALRLKVAEAAQVG